MSEFLCKNCKQPMGLKSSGWFHYDSDCEKPELDEDDAEIENGSEAQ